ncbi:RHS repeat domain-containing protein [Pedobacter sp. ASV28]|uniref:RHS repeat domain-containing protein n=1 Tax=Pedobacter sp. ASV28 TaxID=2795123 RepID=UPI001E645F05|nr:RHS repeat-associated core domain-containing protein [Pedobacter sp. ASV28]
MDGGIARKNGASYQYEYFLKDHLGNTRVVYNEAGSVLQQTDYLPFGMEINRKVSAPKINYTYNGKELQEELGQYDYGARFYDPVIGRWNVVDPLAEKMISISPYIYGVNNPANMIDNDGRYAVSVHYNITYKALLALGYSKKDADVMAHYSSTYADHPSVTVLNFDYLLHGGGKNPQKHNYRNGIDYSLTSGSQDESNSRWHSMMSDVEAKGGMKQREALARGLKFGWDNVFASEGGKNLKKYGQGMHALQDAIAHNGRRTEDHLGLNLPSVGAMYNDMYGPTEKAENLTRSAGIIVRLMAGKEVKFKDKEELDFQGMSADQLSRTIGMLLKAGFQGTINFR